MTSNKNTMSEFVAITDAPFRIQRGSDIDKDFDFNLRNPDVSKSSVLMFRLNTFETETETETGNAHGKDKW